MYFKGLSLTQIKQFFWKVRAKADTRATLKQTHLLFGKCCWELRKIVAAIYKVLQRKRSRKICKINGKTPVLRFLFNKVAVLTQPAKLFEINLWHRIFLWEHYFIEHLRTTASAKNTRKILTVFIFLFKRESYGNVETSGKSLTYGELLMRQKHIINSQILLVFKRSVSKIRK